MNARLLLVLGAVPVLSAAGTTVWWLQSRPPATAELTSVEAAADELPVPPFPPRIADNDQYDKCMTMLADDPEGAEAIATSWQGGGGGGAATHCQALAKIAAGEPEDGAQMLENLAHAGTQQGLTRAVLLGQAAEARL